MADQKLRIDSKRAAFRKVDEELVVLDLHAASYLSINETGTFMWGLLETGATRQELIDAVLGEFDVDEQLARTDVGLFVADLEQRGLLVDDG